MPIRSDETARRQQDRDRLEAKPRGGDPRNFDAPSHELPTPHGVYAGFDADLNLIDDEVINTRGSER